MSWNPALDPGNPDDVGLDAIETVIVPRARDLERKTDLDWRKPR